MIIVLKQNAPEVQVREFCHELQDMGLQINDSKGSESHILGLIGDTKAVAGVDVAGSMGEDPACVYKTLVTQGSSKNYFVFVIPVAAELDLKAAARSVGEKSVAMIHVADINKVTGYVRGGCSPVGMKKQYKTVFDESVLAQEKVYVSGGRIGTQVCCAPADLIRAARATTAKIIF